MDQREKEIPLSEDGKCVRKVAARDWQVIRGNIFTFRDDLWQVLNVPIVHGLILVAENVPEWVKTEQNAGHLIIWEWVDMD